MRAQPGAPREAGDQVVVNPTRGTPSRAPLLPDGSNGRLGKINVILYDAYNMVIRYCSYVIVTGSPLPVGSGGGGSFPASA